MWDASTANPSIQLEMKVKGDRTTGFFATGNPANFTIKLSADGDSRIELPIDPASWDADFQAGEDDGTNLPEEQPGFLVMAALATMTLAAVYLPSREEESENF